MDRQTSGSVCRASFQESVTRRQFLALARPEPAWVETGVWLCVLQSRTAGWRRARVIPIRSWADGSGGFYFPDLLVDAVHRGTDDAARSKGGEGHPTVQGRRQVARVPGEQPRRRAHSLYSYSGPIGRSL